MMQKVLALDVGHARIGVATCDPLGITVRPLTVIQRTSRRADFDRIAELIREQEATAVLCGLPLNVDGSEGEQAISTRKWATRLAHALRAIFGTPLPVLFWDERFTTFEAQQLLAQTEQKVGEDAMAAAVILRSYLEAQKRGGAQDYGSIELERK